MTQPASVMEKSTAAPESDRNLLVNRRESGAEAGKLAAARPVTEWRFHPINSVTEGHHGNQDTYQTSRRSLSSASCNFFRACRSHSGRTREVLRHADDDGLDRPARDSTIDRQSSGCIECPGPIQLTSTPSMTSVEGFTPPPSAARRHGGRRRTGLDCGASVPALGPAESRLCASAARRQASRQRTSRWPSHHQEAKSRCRQSCSCQQNSKATYQCQALLL